MTKSRIKHILLIILIVIAAVAIIITATFILPKMILSKTDTAIQSTTAQATDDIEVMNVSSDSSANILLDSTSIKTSGSGVTVNGTTAVITSGGTYTISGTLTNGKIIVNAEKQVVNLILDGANISCTDSSPINIYKSKQTIITLKDNTANTLTDSANYTFSDNYSSSADSEPSAALFSKSDLVINGNGSLTVNGKYKNGIQSKDTLQIENANITVTAVNDGIKGKDSISAENATVKVTSSGDGIVSNEDTDTTLGFIKLTNCTLTVNSAQDGIQAESSLVIAGGKYSITTANGSANVQTISRSGFGFNESTSSTEISTKGIKAGASITITSGEIIVDSANDAIHSNGTLNMSGGKLTLSAGDDGIHADTSIELTKGTITIQKSYEGIESNNITINGATIYVTATDDGINVSSGNETTNQGGGMDAVSAGDLVIKSGYIYVDAEGDGLDSNGSMNISGGTVIVNGPTNGGNGALDYNGECTVSGGTLVIVGSSGMAQNASSASTQNCVLANFTSQNANSPLCITDSSGNIIVAFKPTKTYSSILISNSSLKSGETYTISAGGIVSGDEKDGLYTNAKYSGGTALESFTVSSTVTSVGANGSMGQNGGQMGGRKGW